MAYDELTARLAKQVSQLEQALAEKERELQQIREHEFQNGYREAEAMWEEKYQQLMVQAVRFAESVADYDPYHDGKRKKDAKAFLKEQQS